MADQIEATFPLLRLAQEARDWLAEEGVPTSDMTIALDVTNLPDETAREGMIMSRIVLIIVVASLFGTGIGAGLGAILSATVGPSGTQGLIIQMVSWAIFAHLLIGMWAGYLLLADRSEREIGRSRHVVLTVSCGNINPNTVVDQMRNLGATEVKQKV